MFNSTSVNISIPEQNTKLIPYTRVECRENIKKDIDNVQEIRKDIQENIVSKQANEINIKLDEYSFYLNRICRDINMSVVFKINKKDVKAHAVIDVFDKLGYILSYYSHNKNILTDDFIFELNKKIKNLVEKAILTTNE